MDIKIYICDTEEDQAYAARGIPLSRVLYLSTEPESGDLVGYTVRNEHKSPGREHESFEQKYIVVART